MNKISLNISPSDVSIVTSLVGHILMGTDIKILKAELPEHYLMFACVYDFFHRIEKRRQEIKIHGYPAGKQVKIVMKRHEAIAFFLLTEESYQSGTEDYIGYLPELSDMTINLIRSIRGDIHKQFLV